METRRRAGEPFPATPKYLLTKPRTRTKHLSRNLNSGRERKSSMDWPGEIDVLILGAVRQEIDALTGLLETCQEHTSRGQTSWFGKYSNLSVLLGTTGLGKVNAAITAACLLERYAVGQVWQIGCAGAYPEGPLRIGDVLITEKALCGDEGVMTKGGVLSGAQIGIPILLHHGEEVFDHVPLQWNEALRSIIQKTPPGLYRQTRGPALAAAHPCDVEDRLHPAARPPETARWARPEVPGNPRFLERKPLRIPAFTLFTVPALRSGW